MTDGGNLDILKAPKHVDGYIKGGPKHGKKQEYWKQKANVRRRKVAEQER